MREARDERHHERERERLSKIFILSVGRESDIWRLRPAGIKSDADRQPVCSVHYHESLETSARLVVRCAHLCTIYLLSKLTFG